MSKFFNDSVADIVSTFVAQMTVAASHAATQQVQAATLSALTRTGVHSTSKAPTHRGRRNAVPSRRQNGPRRRRAPEALAATTEDLAAHIAKHPGAGIEEIARALGTPSRELFLPVKKLLAGKNIVTTGQKRSTRYFPKGVRTRTRRKAD